MTYFVFAKTTDPEDTVWGFQLETKDFKEVKAHMNNRSLYRDPSGWEFKIIRGRELEVNLEATVTVRK